MSIQTCQNNIARFRRELAYLEKQAAEEAKKEVTKAKQIDQIERGITKHTSPSTLRTKQQQITRLSDEIARIQSKKADITKIIADKTQQLHRYEQALRKEQEKEQRKVQEAEKRRQREQLEHERSITRELAEQKRFSQAVRRESPSGTADAEVALAYDVFISHAGEDKDEFVRPLARELEGLGFRVWYDEFQLKVGDSLRRSIDRGLVNSRYGVVVLSSAFFEKNWPQYELDGLVAREASGSKVVLPIWHKVSKDQVMSYSPPLADKVALNSSILSVKEIAQKLAEVLRED